MFSLYPRPRPSRLSGLPSGNAGVRLTLREMSKLVKQFKVDAGMRELAQDITMNLPSYDRVGEVNAIQQFCSNPPAGRIRYVNDIEGAETLQIPPYTLEKRSGDCDDKAVLCNTLLACIGYR